MLNNYAKKETKIWRFGNDFLGAAQLWVDFMQDRVMNDTKRERVGHPNIVN